MDYYYALDNKKNGDLSFLDFNGEYPNDAWLKSNNDNILPVSIDKLSIDSKGEATIKYTKENLRSLIDSKVYKQLSAIQQENINNLYNKLDNNIIAIIVYN